MKPLKVAVIGVGHLGKEHARVCHALPDVTLTAIVDADTQRGQVLAQQYQTQFYTSYKPLLKQELDAVSIVTPTITHYAIAREFIKRGVHTFIEKPITHKTADAQALIKLARQHKTVLQVGHIQRFNPAFQAVLSEIKEPRFIECHRLSGFTARSFDIDVILDLMIHDLDLALALNHAPLKQVEANGVKVLSDKIDIANARLVFRNGCVANLTASRISDKSMRKLRVFTRDAYFSVDFLQPEATIYRRQISGRNLKNLMANVKLSQLSLQELMTQQIYQVQRPQLSQDEPLRLELASFMDCVRTGQRPLVSGEDGYKALALAHQILKKL